MKVDLRLLQRLDNLIYQEGTGNANNLASRLGISRRTVFNYLEYMREDLELPIKWCDWQQSYLYEEEGRLIIKFSQ